MEKLISEMKKDVSAKVTFVHSLIDEIAKENRKPMFFNKSVLDQAPFIQKIATQNDPVLILGPSGSGKEIIALGIHRISLRHKHKFIPINCGGLNDETLLSELFGHTKGAFTGAVKETDGAVKIADGGTLFLDEIGDMPLKAQVALLRFLNNGKYQKFGALGEEEASDTRIICATNKDLKREIEKGNFREDLFYRINVFPITLSAVSSRIELDLKMYYDHFFYDFAKECGLVKKKSEYKPPKISPSALDLLKNYNYPGNYREIRNILKYAFFKCDGKILKKEDLPDYMQEQTGSVDKGDLLSLPADMFKTAINNLILKRLEQEVREKGSVLAAAKTFNMDNGKYKRKMNDAKDGKIL